MRCRIRLDLVMTVRRMGRLVRRMGRVVNYFVLLAKGISVLIRGIPEACTSRLRGQ